MNTIDHVKDIYFTWARPTIFIIFSVSPPEKHKKYLEFSFVVLKSGRFRF